MSILVIVSLAAVVGLSGILYIFPLLLPNSKVYPEYPALNIEADYFNNFKVINVGSVNDYLLSTMSATYASTRALFLVILSTSIILIALKFILKINLQNAILLSLLTLAGNIFLFLQIDDLPDEGYVWASKIDTFIQNGRLGVPLESDGVGESTVGFLQFFFAAVPRSLGLTIEQSIYLPLWIFLTISQVLLYRVIEKYTNSALYGLIVVGAIYTLPVIGFNFALGFDNVIAYSFLIIWLYFELNSNVYRQGVARILLFVTFPIIRLDFIVVSIGIFILHCIENKIISIKSLNNEVKRNFQWYLISLSTLLLWLIYKMWAFGELIPAMAVYKSFHGGEHLIFSGLNYLVNALSINSILSLTIFSYILFTIVWILLWRKKNLTLSEKVLQSFKKQNYRIIQLFILNSIFMLFTSIFAIMAGGDYFGPALMRYQFPFLLVMAMILFLMVLSFSDILNKAYASASTGFQRFYRIDMNLIFLFTVMITILFFKPYSFHTTFEDIKQLDRSGRVTCEAAAAFAIFEAFPKINTIATPEVNGISYHSNSNLIDLIGLVDTNVKTDGYIGDSLHKFRILQTDKHILKADLLWLWPGAECANSKEKLTDETKYAERLQNLVNSFPGNFRIIDFSRYKEGNFIPYVIEYKFNSAGENFNGIAFTFVKPR
jgi:hypothetical protein